MSEHKSNRRFIPWTSTLTMITLVFSAPALYAQQAAAATDGVGPLGELTLPMGRTAYFVGETVPLALRADAAREVKLEAVNADGRFILYQGRPRALLLDSSRLAPGDYRLEIDGRRVVERFTLVSTWRKSAGSIQDEVAPYSSIKPDDLVRILKESGLTACIAMAQSDMGRALYLDTMARAGALLMVNPDTRPTSFVPARNHPLELDGMCQRMILTAQANGRYPNFGGFCYGWDTTGFALDGRKMLLTYWGWGEKTRALRNYIDRIDAHVMAQFTRRTAVASVSEAEYLSYLMSINRPEFGTAIDLPTKLWLEEIARRTSPMSEDALASFEKRLDAWSGYLMGLYNETYSVFSRNLRGVDPALRHTASVQVDHAAVRQGQYFPSAYAPLDFQYQSAWNDQVGGPDYAYQWLLTAALLEMHRGGRPTWISTSLAPVHGRANYPGKLTRVAAHGLAFGLSGIGFAQEGFSNVLGGMNSQTHWANMRGKAGQQDVLAGGDFLDRFACLALEGRGDHGVGILFSKSQYQRQHIAMGFGNAPYLFLVALSRLGYTPRFVTEEELAADEATDVGAIVVLGQTFPLSKDAENGLHRFVAAGGRVLVDDNTTVSLPRAERLGLGLPLAVSGKPHNWSAPNIVAGDNDALMYARRHAELAPGLSKALGDTGRGLFASEKGPRAMITLMQIDGGADATYVVAVNDSHVRTQADWHQVTERLVPTEGAAGMLYDCTEEKSLGKLRAIDCDLSKSTARVFAVLPGELKTIAVSATQDVETGRALTVQVEFIGAGEKHFDAVLPFCVALVRPDGKVYQEFYRSTDRHGVFAISLPMPANAPTGKWSVAVRSQLTGRLATLPVTVRAGQHGPVAVPVSETVTVREREAAEKMLHNEAIVVLPVFDSPLAEKLLPVAEKVKEVLAGRGVTVEIRTKPQLSTYTLAYDPTDSQEQENSRIDHGEAIGRIKRETVNANDWYSALSGWRFGKPVILLDLAGVKDDNPMAESLQPTGILWPEVSEAFPGAGRAVVQAVHWAFAPRTTALVIQAMDTDGLMAGAGALARLPTDRITSTLREAKQELWRQYHVGGKPEQPKCHDLTSGGLRTRHAPQPFAIRFVGAKPPRAQDVTAAAPHVHPVRAVPGLIEPAQYVPYVLGEDGYYESSTASSLLSDLRFSQAIKLYVDVRKPGRMRISAGGTFRYSDRQPRSQAQWEQVLALRKRLVKLQHKPMEIEVRHRGKTIGRLLPVKTEIRDMPIETLPSYARQKPKTVREKVVVELAGEVDLPAGRQELLLIHRNVVDGYLNRLRFAITFEQANDVQRNHEAARQNNH